MGLYCTINLAQMFWSKLAIMNVVVVDSTVRIIR